MTNDSNNNTKLIKFNEYKDQIIAAIERNSNLLQINEPVTLVDGFVNQPVSSELSGSFIIGGPTIPLVMLVGNTTGRVYYFALKALLPRIEI